MTNGGQPRPNQDSNVVETIQSLVVAFVLAMTFRGFVTEGFVIPTGSMAPTLLGQHALIHSEATGYEFPVGLDQANLRPMFDHIADPMLGEKYPGSGVPAVRRERGMGDRILVLKTLYPFSEPRRFDVVVFKNPTDPTGETSNYIKRLIGLPNEQVWLSDGDVFAKPVGGDEFRIQRKPEHVQRAVWQRLFDSDFAPIFLEKLDQRYFGPPWIGDPQTWDMSLDRGRAYRSTTAELTTLTWDTGRRPLSDWTAYNMLDYISHPTRLDAVNDLRVAASLTAEQTGLQTTLEIEARSHLFQFTIKYEGANSQATLRLVPLSAANGGERAALETTAAISLPNPGRVFNVEFWHVDQAMRLFINGEEVIEPLEYDWSALQRLQFATGDLENDDVDVLLARGAKSAQVRWRFEGSPVTLQRVRLDRDLHYRHEMIPGPGPRTIMPHPRGHAFGTHPEENPGVLGPDQFMMCGDNSQRSLDSRLWGRPHPLVKQQIGDDSAFTVHRKLLIGKAWVIYFPAPYPIMGGGPSVVPDFGRLRFIR